MLTKAFRKRKDNRWNLGWGRSHDFDSPSFNPSEIAEISSLSPSIITDHSIPQNSHAARSDFAQLLMLLTYRDLGGREQTFLLTLPKTIVARAPLCGYHDALMT